MKNLLVILPAFVLCAVGFTSCKKDVIGEVCNKYHEFIKEFTGAEIAADWTKVTEANYTQYSLGYEVETCIKEDVNNDAVFHVDLDTSKFMSNMPVELYLLTVTDDGNNRDTVSKQVLTSTTVLGTGGVISTESEYYEYSYFFRVRVYGGAPVATKDAYISQYITNYKITLHWIGVDD